jgi:hypothetical protein
MSDKIKNIIIAAILAIAGIGSVSYVLKQPDFLYSQIESENNGKTISYTGKDGITALDLLKSKADIETVGTDENAYVTTIDDVAANPTNQYWMFKINGEMAEVGGGSYITKDSETITWELTSF